MTTVADLQAEISVDGADRSRRELDTFGDSIDRTAGRAGRSSAGFLSLSKATLAVGAGAAVAGVAFNQVWGATTSVEDAFAPLGTILGANSKQYEDLTGRLSDFVSSSPQSAAEIGEAAYLTLSAGITDVDDAMQALGASKDLAQAGLGTIGQATDLVTSAMNSFTGEHLTAEKAAQLFFGTIASGKTTTSELAQGFGNIAPLAASAGVKFEELLSATAAMTGAGQSASEAYTGLRGIIGAVLSPTAEAAKAAETLGINFSQAHLKSVGLPKFLDEIKVATGGNVETMATLFGGVEGLNAVLALTGPQAGAFAKNLTGIADAGDNLSERSAEMESTLSKRWSEFKNKATVAMSEVGLKAADWLIPKFEQLGAWVSEHWPEISRVLEQAGQVATEVFSAYGKYIEWLAETFRKYWPEISATISDAVETIRAEFTAVVEVATALWNNFHDNVYEVVQRVWPTIRQQFRGIFETIRGVFGLISGLVSGDWSKVWENVKKIVHGAWDFIVGLHKQMFEVLRGLVGIGGEILGAAWDAIWEWVADRTSAAWEWIKQTTGNALAAIGRWLSEFPGKALALLTGIGGVLLAKGVELIGGLFGGIVTKALEIWVWFGALPGRVMGYFSSAATWLLDVGRDIIQGLWDGMQDIWDDVTGWLGGLGGKIVDLKGPPARDAVLLTNAGRLVMRGFQAGLKDGWRDVQGTLAGFGGELAGPSISTLSRRAAGGFASPTTSATFGSPSAFRGGDTITNIHIERMEFPNVRDRDDVRGLLDELRNLERETGYRVLTG